MRCSSYCIATSFNMASLINHFRPIYVTTRFREVVHIHINSESRLYRSVRGEGDVFFFPYGVIVFWGLSDKVEHQIKKEIEPFVHQYLSVIEEDIFDYEYNGRARIQDDEIILPDADVLTKLAFSHGIAQSVKLSAFEQTIQKTIHLTKQLPELLACKGSIKLSRKDIRKMMGRLFIDRSSINLHQELLDTPEFFWEHSELEPYYNMVAHHLDRETRVSVLNERLRVLQELFDMLATELNHQHSSRLEWTIIFLIVIEVVLTILKDVLQYL